MPLRLLAVVLLLSPSACDRVRVGAREDGAHADPRASATADRSAETESDPAAEAVRAARGEAVRLADDGRQRDAIQVIERALAANPGHPQLTDDLGVLSANFAIELVQAGDFAEADGMSRRALEIEPGNDTRRSVRAAVLWQLSERVEGDDERRELWGEVLAVDAEHPGALARLGEDAFQANRLAEAIEYYERAVAARPDSRDLRAQLERVRRNAAVEGDFEDVGQGNFVVLFEGFGQQSLAWNAVYVLDRAYYEINDKLGLEPGRKISVVIYTGGQYSKALGMPDWSAGAYDGKIRIRAGDLQEKRDTLDDVLYHEYVHAVLHSALGDNGIPTWLNEGLAQYHEPRRPAVNPNWLRMNRGRLMPVGVLANGFTGFSADRADVAYAQSLAFVSFLIDRFGEYDMQRLLQALEGGTPFATAFRETFYATPAELDAEWRQTL